MLLTDANFLKIISPDIRIGIFNFIVKVTELFPLGEGEGCASRAFQALFYTDPLFGFDGLHVRATLASVRVFDHVA